MPVRALRGDGIALRLRGHCRRERRPLQTVHGQRPRAPEGQLGVHGFVSLVICFCLC